MSTAESQTKVLSSKPYFTKDDFKSFSKFRIIQKNLVHVQGFPDSMADKFLLSQPEYFGQFGTITKLVVVSKENEFTNKKSNSAYITFSTNEEAAYAVLTIDSIMLEGHIVRAFFGTSKYCIHFLNNAECFNKEKCMFLHELADNNDILGANSKFGYSEHIKLAKEIINFYSSKTKKFIMNYSPQIQTVLPNIMSILSKDNVDSSNSNNNTNNINNNYNGFVNNNKSVNTNKAVYISDSSMNTGNSIINNVIVVNNNNDNYKDFNQVNNDILSINTIDLSTEDSSSLKFNDYNQTTNCISTIFKHRNESRFFNENFSEYSSVLKETSSDNNDLNNNDIPQNILTLIDQLFLRIPFFKKFENFFDFKTCELVLCKNKYKNTNDNWFDFIVKNTRI
jgi:hypothetical protein